MFFNIFLFYVKGLSETFRSNDSYHCAIAQWGAYHCVWPSDTPKNSMLESGPILDLRRLFNSNIIFQICTAKEKNNTSVKKQQTTTTKQKQWKKCSTWHPVLQVFEIDW